MPSPSSHARSFSPLAAYVLAGAGAILEGQSLLRLRYQRLDQEVTREAEQRVGRGEQPAEVARWAVWARNRAKVDVRAWDIDLVRVLAERRNRQVYGDPVGPSYEQLRSAAPAGPSSAEAAPGGPGDAELIKSAGRSNGRVNRTAALMAAGGLLLLALAARLAVGRGARRRGLRAGAFGVALAAAAGWPSAKLLGLLGLWLGALAWGASVLGAALGAAFGGLLGALLGGLAGQRIGARLLPRGGREEPGDGG